MKQKAARPGWAVLILAVFVAGGLRAQQEADPSFNPAVERPAYTGTHPRVVIDEAHSNFHTAAGRYKPLAELLRNDGYEVVAGTAAFSRESLGGVRVLLIANAAAPDAGDDSSGPAFNDAECDAVRDWVREGGSLLVLADHAPFGSAAEPLAARFGVGMGKGFVFDLRNSDRGPSALVFSRENGLLGEHPLLRGRDASESVNRVVAFTGQSLSAPEGAAVLLQLSPTAYEVSKRDDVQAAILAVRTGGGSAGPAQSVAGRAQGVAFAFGKGRVVVLGEAGMFSAQLIRFEQGGIKGEMKMGMNVEGNDDRQFALNVLHWLSGILD